MGYSKHAKFQGMNFQLWNMHDNSSQFQKREIKLKLGM